MNVLKINARVRLMHIKMREALSQPILSLIVEQQYPSDAEHMFALAAVLVRVAMDCLGQTGSPLMFSSMVLHRVVRFVDEAWANPNEKIASKEPISTQSDAEAEKLLRRGVAEVEDYVRRHPNSKKIEIYFGTILGAQVVEDALDLCVRSGTLAMIPSEDGFVYIATPQRQDPEAPGQPNHVAKPTEAQCQAKRVLAVEEYVRRNPGCSKVMILTGIVGGNATIRAAIDTALGEHLIFNVAEQGHPARYAVASSREEPRS